MINHYKKEYTYSTLKKWVLWGRDTKLPLHILGCDVYLYPTAMVIKFTDGNSKYEFTDSRSIMQYLAKAKHHVEITNVYGFGRVVYIGRGKITTRLSEMLCS